LKRADEKDKTKVTELAYRALGKGKRTFAVPVVFIVPTNEKLRLEFRDAYGVAYVIRHAGPQLAGVVWDIKVSDVRRLRDEWFNSASMAPGAKLSTLKRNLPRYCWRIVLSKDKVQAFEVLLDCTAADAATSVIAAVSYSAGGDKLLGLIYAQLEANVKVFQTKDSKVDERVLTRLVEVLEPWKGKHLSPASEALGTGGQSAGSSSCSIG
jgi:hypothetical protein